MVVRLTVPWFNKSFRVLKSKRRNLERKMLNSGLQSDTKNYRQVRNDYSVLLNDARFSHFSDLIEECAGDSKKLFTVVSCCEKRSSRDHYHLMRIPATWLMSLGSSLMRKSRLSQVALTRSHLL